MISESGLALLSADDLDQAAKKAVAVSQIMEIARHNDLRVTIDSLPEASDAENERERGAVVTPL